MREKVCIADFEYDAWRLQFFDRLVGVLGEMQSMKSLLFYPHWLLMKYANFQRIEIACLMTRLRRDVDCE